MAQPLHDKSVLVLEDETIIAMDIALTLEEHGFSVQGPFKCAETALAAIEEETPHFALLDMNLGRGETSEAVAHRLSALDCPFLFLTGYHASSHPVIEKFPDVECLSKPVNVRDVIERIDACA